MSLEYANSGMPFTFENIMNLTIHTSYKSRADDNQPQNDEPDTTGKFGTGFFTTYLLSKLVDVKGIYKSTLDDETVYKHFTFTLDRDTNLENEMLEKHLKICEIF